MDRSHSYSGVKIGRALALTLTFALTSCVPMQKSTGEGSQSEVIASNESVPVSENRTLASETLLPKTAQNFGLSYVQQTDGDKVIINTTSKNTPYEIVRLQNPSRLVVDINEPLKGGASKNVAPSTSEIISSVRVGSHGTKSRIVLDLKQSGIQDSISQEGNSIVISLPGSNAALATKLNANGSKQSIAAAISQERKQEVAIAEPIEQVIEKVSVPPSKETIQLNAKPRISGLTIEQIPGRGNALIADAPGIQDFEFIQTAPSEYVLTLHKASLDDAVSQTILAPARSGLIRSVRPVEKDGDVLLRVFAQPEAMLEAALVHDRIMVREIAGLPEQARAQVSPDVTAESPKDTTVAAGKETKKTEKAEVTSSDEKVLQPVTNDDLSALLGGDQKYTGRLISLDLQDTDIDNALRIIAEVSNLNIIASSEVAGKVTLRLIDVPWDQALDVILKTNGLDKVQEGNVVRIAPVDKLRQEREALKQAQLAEDELEPLSVKYVRVSYARVTDLQPLIQGILTERGTVTVDARSNQVIIKDIKKGLKNAVDLISKLDLRTPQVLLETQIVEANRSILRELGSQLGFSFIQSPETGNPTGFNFPNSISVGGGIPNSQNASNFPAAIAGEGSAIAAIFGSADGTKSLDVNISTLEKEGRVRIVSRPSVATTNNKSAEITSNETISVKKPSSGSTTVVGSGSSSSDASATEKIKAGITLKVTPQASPDYYVLMDIEAVSSTFGARTVEGIPSIVERKATSTVLVSSGQTFAIGGIYRLIDKDEVAGVPFLKDVPVLGTLFRRTKVDNSDEELLFFITPRIIEGSFDDAAMSTAS